MFIEWVRGITDQIEGVVAIDGKTVRRSKDNSKDADYILSLKGNQQTLYDDVSLYLKEEVLNKPKKELEKRNQYYREINNENGRLEIREYYVETDISWLRQRSEWEKLNGVAVCVSTVTKNDETTVSYNYGIFSREGMSAKEYGNACRIRE